MTDVALASLMAQAATPSGALSRTLFLAASFIAIFYFILIRPQKKEQERHQEMISALQKGDEVVTSGGIIGTVIRAEEERLIIKTAGDTRITVERGRVARKLGGEAPQR